MEIDGQFLQLPVTSVMWSFQSITTTLQIVDTSLNKVFVNVPASLLTTPGTASVEVMFGSSTSNTLDFTITATR